MLNLSDSSGLWVAAGLLVALALVVAGRCDKKCISVNGYSPPLTVRTVLI